MTLGQTQLKRLEQYKDRWTSYGANMGILELSEKPTPQVLKQFEIFKDYDEKFLEKFRRTSLLHFGDRAPCFSKRGAISTLPSSSSRVLLKCICKSNRLPHRFLREEGHKCSLDGKRLPVEHQREVKARCTVP